MSTERLLQISLIVIEGTALMLRRLMIILMTLVFNLLAIALHSCTQVNPNTHAVQAGGSDIGKPSEKIQKVGELPRTGLSYSFQFINDREGWLVGGNDLWRTVNGGASWQLVYSSDDKVSQIQKFEFLGPQVGWLLRLNGLYTTEDGGTSWKKISLPSKLSGGELRDVHFLSGGMVGWLAGGIYSPRTRDEILSGGFPNNTVSPDFDAVLYGCIFRTNDGGKTWSQQFISRKAGRFLAIHFLDTAHGIATGDVGIYHTATGGRQWTSADLTKECVDKQHSNFYEQHPVMAAFLDTNTGWLIYDDGYLVKTTDGGRSWCELVRLKETWPEGQNIFFKEIYFDSLTHGWGLNGSGFIYEIEDCGKTWIRTNTDIRFEDMYFLDANHGWVVSRDTLFRINF